MSGKLRQKVTYSNVVATLALFIALGGAAFAAGKLPKNSVGTKQIKNGAVTGQKVAKNTLIGANIDASTLGTVPSATHAASADSATHAGSADSASDAAKLGGALPTTFQKRVTGSCGAGESIVAVLEGGGVDCTANGGPPSGPAGGALSGTYPDPLLAGGSVGTSAFAGGATAPNATKLNGIESSGYVQSGQAAGGALSGTYPNPTLATRPAMATATSGATTTLTGSCTHYANAEVTINAPSSGTVLVSSNVFLLTSHTNGVQDSMILKFGTSATDCTTPIYWASPVVFPGSMPTFSLTDMTVPVQSIFSVAPGSHTYYLNGIQEAGNDTEQFFYAGIVATFIPS